MDTLKELYIDQLQDLWSANRQARKITERLCKAANNNELRSMLERSLDHISEHNERLEDILDNYDASPDEQHCKGMEGLVAEAKKHALETDYSDDNVRDAQIISQYQRMTHYGIAVYGTCRALAEHLGIDEEVTALAQDLEDVKEGDRVMSRIAQESVNRRAA